jgi:hypothetical protein
MKIFRIKFMNLINILIYKLKKIKKFLKIKFSKILEINNW